MKNLLESLALFFVAILSLAIVFFIVQYNLIEDDSISSLSTLKEPKKITASEKNKSYLNTLEEYGNDTDVKVDVMKESGSNKISIEPEVHKDDIAEVLDDTSNLSDVEKLPQDEIVDEIGMAIDAALDDL